MRELVFPPIAAFLFPMPVPALVLLPIPVPVPEVPALLFVMPPVPVVVPVLLVVVPVVFPLVPPERLPLLVSRTFPVPEPEQPPAQIVKLVIAISVKSFRIEFLRVYTSYFCRPIGDQGTSKCRWESLLCSSLLTVE